jgi:hypothetical protein
MIVFALREPRKGFDSPQRRVGSARGRVCWDPSAASRGDLGCSGRWGFRSLRFEESLEGEMRAAVTLLIYSTSTCPPRSIEISILSGSHCMGRVIKQGVPGSAPGDTMAPMARKRARLVPGALGQLEVSVD